MSLPSRRTKREKKKNYLFYSTVFFLAMLCIFSLLTANYPALVLLAGLNSVLCIPRLFFRNLRRLYNYIFLGSFFVIWLGIFLWVIP